MIVTAGKTNVSVYYYIVGDASHASPGDPITGLLFSDFETGGSASYTRQGAARVDLTLITLASASAAHADGGFILVDDTNLPGVYRCDYPDAAFATGVDQLICGLVAASANNAAIAPILIDITDVDLRDVASGGMTTLADWINGGRLDLLLDAIPTTAMRGTDSAYTGTPPTAAAIVNEWETQSQADPTGFHVNVLEIGGTAQTANDNGADINTLLSRIIGTLATGTHNPATAAQIAVLSDWINGGRLDLILDARMAEASINTTAGAVDNVTLVATTTTNTDMRGTDSAFLAASLNTTAGAVDNVTLVATTTTNTDMRGTDSANTVVPDVAGTAPTAVENRQEMDSNSTQLNTTIPGLIDDLAIKKNTAFSNYEFLMVLTSDHVTPATGLTVTAQRSIDGGAFASVSGSIAEVSNGIYQFDALAADTNGDVITWRFSSGTADDTFFTFKTSA